MRNEQPDVWKLDDWFQKIMRRNQLPFVIGSERRSGTLLHVKIVSFAIIPGI